MNNTHTKIVGAKRIRIGPNTKDTKRAITNNNNNAISTISLAKKLSMFTLKFRMSFLVYHRQYKKFYAAFLLRLEH